MRWVDTCSAGTIPQLFPVIDVVRKRCLADVIVSFKVFVNEDFYRPNACLVGINVLNIRIFWREVSAWDARVF